MMDIVALFPGQGSQKPGMGRDLADAWPEARAVFDAANEALDESLSALCFEGPAETLTLTHNAQPALLTHGAAVWAILRDRLGDKLRAAAGHSLGEFTAYHVAGSLTLRDAVRLVRRRGELMYETGVLRPGTMAAILGDTSPKLDEICRQASEDPEGGLVVAANYNAFGQVVISGEVAGVQKASELAKAAGAKRAIPLTVSGAFHSPLMEPARTGLALALDELRLEEPSVPVYANVTTEPVLESRVARRLLVEQLTAPVLWSSLVGRMATDFPNALFVEMGPGTVLTSLMKKIAPALAAASCGTADDVEQLLARAA
jgi:[acyl-carrier-protein] S-malonyltransferase